MYLTRVEITFIEPCMADPEKVRFEAVFDRDIGEMLPYLNRTISNAAYNHEAGILTYTEGIRMVTLYTREMTVAKVRNTTEAHQFVDSLRDMLNDMAVRRDQIEPMYRRRRRPSVIDILGMLPDRHYNCRRCGELTCLAFAAALIRGDRNVEQCCAITTPSYRKVLRTLKNLLGANKHVDA